MADGIVTTGGIAMVDGTTMTCGLATANGLQTVGSQYILTGPQSILATEEPAMLVTVLAVRRRRSRCGTEELQRSRCSRWSLALSLATDRRTQRTDGASLSAS
jgi:hypothetical protein